MDELIERTWLTAKILRWMEAAALAAIVEEAATALEDAQLGLREAVRVWVLSDEIVWSEEKIDEVVDSIIADAKKEKGKCLD